MNSLLTISLSQNTLKASAYDKNVFKHTSLNLTHDVVNGSKIVDKNLFAESIQNAAKELQINSLKDYTLNFLVEPWDIVLKFVVINKNKGEVADQVALELSQKIDENSLENIFYSYEKIAPFTYQVVAVKKEFLEDFMEIANILKAKLYSVVPWIMLLPKYTNKHEACIFTSKDGNDQVVALSELNGIYFVTVFHEEKSPKELQQIVKDLSIYKRQNPINKIYTVNFESFSLDPEYDVFFF